MANRLAEFDFNTPQLQVILATLRDVSGVTDANDLAAMYADRVRELFPFDRVVSVSVRGLQSPLYRITRSDLWTTDRNPWTDREKLPIYSRGILGTLIAGGQVVLNNDFHVDDFDPAFAHLEGMRSLVAIPLFDAGEPLNMVVHASRDVDAFDRTRLDELVLLSSFFGQTINGLVARKEVLRAQAWTKLQNDSLQQLSDTVMEQALELQRHTELLDSRVRQRTAQLHEAHLQTIEMLATACEAKDADTGEHIRRIRKLTTDLAIELGVPQAEAESLGLAAMLHDVGKLHIPDKILNKPGRLTDAERKLMQTHTTAGEHILAGTDYYQTARVIARSHHENFDGTGYPDNLAGQAIPLGARIVRVVDFYDAVTSQRVYKLPWAKEAALEAIEQGAGSLFDPAVVKAFLKQQGFTPHRVDVAAAV